MPHNEKSDSSASHFRYLTLFDRWVREDALRMWAIKGYDPVACRFHEALNFDLSPVENVPYRLMVQARQVGIYARAALVGWVHDAGEMSQAAFRSMRNNYRADDGGNGWRFAVDASGRSVDEKRDLYAHAFVLYALAWSYKLTGDKQLISDADDVLGYIDRVFATNGPGYAASVPVGRTYEQNPNMHLLEALLALAEVVGAERFLIRASALVVTFDQIFSDQASGALFERFDWKGQPIGTIGVRPVEPGHQLEWAWLLYEYQRLSGEHQDERVDRLFDHATRYGINSITGQVYDETSESGNVLSSSSRTWPHSEAMRALVRGTQGGSGEWFTLADKIAQWMMATHCSVRLQGGWVDRVDAFGRNLSDNMPASTLYHVAGAAMDMAEMLAFSR